MISSTEVRNTTSAAVPGFECTLLLLRHMIPVPCAVMGIATIPAHWARVKVN